MNSELLRSFLTSGFGHTAADRHRPARGRFSRFFAVLGPGLITGAADDDPSAIATYSIAGAQLGTSVLWTAFITWPLIAAIQMMCARIGFMTGRGLVGALRQKFPPSLVALAALGLSIANTITVGADLSGMADAAEMLTGLNSHYYIVLFGTAIALGTILFRYRQIAKLLKWFTLSLFAYVLTAFALRPDWGALFRETFLPPWPSGPAIWPTLVAILGATVSPYMFFWQASQELEERKSPDLRMRVEEEGESRKRMADRKLDVAAGTMFSNLTMYFIILTTGLTLHRSGITSIETSADAAEALKPLAGPFAAALFTVGIVGAGLVAIPTLIGSAAYAIAETFRWAQGLNEKFNAARPFYGVIILSSVIGVALDLGDIPPLKALFWAAVVNGVLAPFLLIGILIVASDRKIMRQQPSSLLAQLTVAVTALAMLGAAIGMFVF